MSSGHQGRYCGSLVNSGLAQSHPDLVARVPGSDKAQFDAAVRAAEIGCPVSKLFKAEISVSAASNPENPGVLIEHSH